MVKYTIKKVFTGGVLKGLSHEDTITFANDALAAQWLEAINLRTNLNYKVVSSGKIN